MKKTLDENSFFVTDNALSNLTEGEFKHYLKMHGVEVYRDVNCWVWKRTNLVEHEFNFMTREELTEKQLEWIRKGYLNGPGTSVATPVSIETYNSLAKWDAWPGAYVENLGYVGVPSSSEYGCPIYSGSWYSRGSSANPFRTETFYKLQHSERWPGGEVERWGYVSPYTKVLGSSLSFKKVLAGERQLGNIYNLSAEVGYTTIDLYRLKEQFKSSYDEYQQNYDIDDLSLRIFLNSQFYPSSNTDIRKALAAKDGIILRIVTREGTVNGNKVYYGNDFLIVDYNELLRTYLYVDPINLSVGSIKADILRDSTVMLLKFIYKKQP